ncbi:AAA family ATPase [Novosphingobium sp. G106]|uniref:phosphotransferase-like protein n=1 Tax=Novosphingobium sp. G106 TaxID=2849500 RepID=UPI001C2D37A3|nr:AAA family ATPase [Novosphingobium sp. G106]MBV1687168.1 AAA family ATPase [Novosphingobium sp. G106]
MTGQVIVVTGTSGAGKTTTCQTFARRADDCWMMLGLDLLTGTMVPGKYSMFGANARDFFYDLPAGERGPGSPAQIDYGPKGWQALHAMHDMIAAAAKSGQDIIVDHCTWVDPPILQDLIWRLEEVPVLFVVLKPDRKVLAQRVTERKLELPASMIDVLGRDGAAEIGRRLEVVVPWFYDAAYANDVSDLVLDTTKLDPDTVCERIAARLAEGPGTAFDQLRALYSKPDLLALAG